ncbi:twin-arginine translocase TatA/TatE family subunit [Puniceicoccaceae bacterium K14]|nr:twin-arginine translocase TatA/TatE family subunit [Puniceicoccaceae bacterium K14]
MTPAITSLAFLTTLGWPEIMLIFGVFILLFGAKKLPELARSMGKSIKEFKKATSSIEDDIRSAMDEDVSEKKIDPKEKEASNK